MATAAIDPIDTSIPIDTGKYGKNKSNRHAVETDSTNWIHTDDVYNALINAASVMENRLQVSLKNYQDHPDVQANLQKLQYDLQSWNLALTTMTNIQKNMSDALQSIANNFK